MADMHVTQWCDSPEGVHEIIAIYEQGQPSLQALWDIGCHWVPWQMPARGTVLDVVNVFELNGSTWHLVKVDIEGAEKPGFTLIKVT